MKNLLDTSLYFSVITHDFSVITHDSLMQAMLLDANQAQVQSLLTTPDVLNVLQQPTTDDPEQSLLPARSGDDLLLSFRVNDERPSLILENFFSNGGRL